MNKLFKIKCGKYKGRIVKGELTSPLNVLTCYGNYFFEPDTIIEIKRR